MRTLNKNKQEMKFSSKGEPEPIYVTDENGNKVIEYITEEGKPIYKETGEYTSGWSEPVIFYGNIAQSGGEAEAREFGLSVADYDAVVDNVVDIMNKMNFIKEHFYVKRRRRNKRRIP